MAARKIRGALGGLILAAATTAGLAGEGGFCGALQAALDAAEAGDRFAAITGPDAGLFHETAVELPGAQRCGVNPDEFPAAAWRCLVQSEGKYILAQREHGKITSRVAGCLGSGWSREDAKVAGYLRWVEFQRADSAVRVRVTASVSDAARGTPHRIVVGVLSPQPLPPGLAADRR